MPRRTLPLIAVAVLACGGPAPVPSPSQPSAVEAPSAEPTQPPHAAFRDMAAERLDVLPDQLLLVEDGFVTARFREDDDGTLQLVWIGPAGESLDERLLAEVAEPRSGPTQSTLSVNAAVCPAGSGLARTRYLFGQETNERTLELGGVPSVGGAVTDGTYVFAIAGESFDASTRWEISDESGDLVSDGDGTWFASPPSSSPDTCAITSDH